MYTMHYVIQLTPVHDVLYEIYVNNIDCVYRYICILIVNKVHIIHAIYTGICVIIKHSIVIV